MGDNGSEKKRGRKREGERKVERWRDAREGWGIKGVKERERERKVGR